MRALLNMFKREVSMLSEAVNSKQIENAYNQCNKTS